MMRRGHQQMRGFHKSLENQEQVEVWNGRVESGERISLVLWEGEVGEKELLCPWRSPENGSPKGQVWQRREWDLVPEEEIIWKFTYIKVNPYHQTKNLQPGLYPGTRKLMVSSQESWVVPGNRHKNRLPLRTRSQTQPLRKPPSTDTQLPRDVSLSYSSKYEWI